MNRRTNPLWLVAVLPYAIVSPAHLSAAPAPNFSWETTAAGRSTALAVPATGKTGFHRMPSSETGIAFANRITRERYTTNQIYLNGSGVTAGDVDGDGWCDLFFAGLSGTSRLYHNEGNWKFTDVTSSAGVACAGLDVTGAALVDVDGDNDLDLLVNTVGSGTHLFLNDGKGHFSHQPVLNPRRCGASLALADLDGDGALDLYVANYRLETIRDEPDSRFRINQTEGRVVVLEYNGRPTTDPDLVGRFTTDSKGKILENGEPDAIFHNDGQGRFSALSFTNGNFLDEAGRPLREPPYDWGLSVMLRDFNGDGAPDIYVCNDFASPDRIWINLGHGKFQALAGTAWRHTSMFSMGVDVADVNRDGWDDL
ncbi:MAG TPA: VCBS repeat-containing protein, partial [Candidatus Dormibacteraeota bacterium]|nr:VCBS repeat-containing protein [Candidatus Dormibacteraeota bacterium]